jgi:hypothetical protein
VFDVLYVLSVLSVLYVCMFVCDRLCVCVSVCSGSVYSRVCSVDVV